MASLHPRHRIDATGRDVLFALAAVAGTAPAAAPARPETTITCLSVRSAFDLLLSALDLPAGDEVLVSAITHPDMARIVRLHGLRPVPVDVDPSTLAPDPLALRAALSPRTRVVLIAHLFGARVDLGAVVRFALDRHLLVVEDCAQSLEGPVDHGDPRAGVSLFSFGLIKTATAFGGARAYVRDPVLARRMHELHGVWPVQPRPEYARKVAKAAGGLVLAHPRLYGALARRWDLAALVRTIPSDAERTFLRWIRRRPSPALAAVVERRLRRFPADRLAARTAAGDDLASALPSQTLRPGCAAARTTHWLFPVVVADPSGLIASLWASGFEATQGTSQIEAITPAPPCARRVMEGIVFLPAYPEMPTGERVRLAEVVRAFV